MAADFVSFVFFVVSCLRFLSSSPSLSGGVAAGGRYVKMSLRQTPGDVPGRTPHAPREAEATEPHAPREAEATEPHAEREEYVSDTRPDR
jgi:hypothetical protein